MLHRKEKHIRTEEEKGSLGVKQPGPDLLSDNSLLACKPLSLHLGLFLLNPREEERSLADQAKTNTEQLQPWVRQGLRQPLGLGPVTPVPWCGHLSGPPLCGCPELSPTLLADPPRSSPREKPSAGLSTPGMWRILQGMARPRSELCKTQYEYAFALEQSAATAAVKGS